jgi:hypothetical protein
MQAKEAAVARAGEVLELRQHVAALQHTVEHLLTASPHGSPHHHAQEAALGAKVEGLKVSAPAMPVQPGNDTKAHPLVWPSRRGVAQRHLAMPEVGSPAFASVAMKVARQPSRDITDNRTNYVKTAMMP